MVRLSNGHQFKYMVASGALAFDGQGWPWEKLLVWLGLIKPELFTVVIKTLTRHPRKGSLKWWNPLTWLPWSPWSCVRFIPGGAVNKVGLTNPGIDWWCEKVAPKIDFQKFSIVASIFGDETELVEMTGMLNRFEIKAIEINVSCANADHDSQTATIVKCVKAVRAVSKHPVIVKLSADQDCLTIAKSLHGFVEAISLNSVPWSKVYPDKKSPLSKLEERVGGGGGGVSGTPAQHFNWYIVKKLSELSWLPPVIGPSVMNIGDVFRVRALGAKAVSFGAIHLRTPWRPTTIVENLRDPSTLR